MRRCCCRVFVRIYYQTLAHRMVLHIVLIVWFALPTKRSYIITPQEWNIYDVYSASKRCTENGTQLPSERAPWRSLATVYNENFSARGPSMVVPFEDESAELYVKWYKHQPHIVIKRFSSNPLEWRETPSHLSSHGPLVPVGNKNCNAFLYHSMQKFKFCARFAYDFHFCT